MLLVSSRTWSTCLDRRSPALSAQLHGYSDDRRPGLETGPVPVPVIAYCTNGEAGRRFVPRPRLDKDNMTNLHSFRLSYGLIFFRKKNNIFSFITNQ